MQKTLRRQAAAINKHTAKGTYFFDYGNAFLLEASRAGADVMAAESELEVVNSNILLMCKTLWDQCASITDLDHSVGFVLLENQKI